MILIQPGLKNTFSVKEGYITQLSKMDWDSLPFYTAKDFLHYLIDGKVKLCFMHIILNKCYIVLLGKRYCVI